MKATTALFAALCLLASRAHAYGDATHPFVFGNDTDPHKQADKYTPALNNKGSFEPADNEKVIISAALYRDSFTKTGPRCLKQGASVTAERVVDSCANAEVLTYKTAVTKDHFKLEADPTHALAVVAGKLVAVLKAEAGEFWLEHRIDGAPEGGVYDRNVLHYKKGSEESGLVFLTSGNTPAVTLRITNTVTHPHEVLPANAAKTFYSGVALLHDVAGHTPKATLAASVSSKLKEPLTRLVKDLAVAPLPVKPNVVLFFVDTFRADAVSNALMPKLRAAFDIKADDALPFARSFSGASATQQSTYSLLNMRPAFERESIIRKCTSGNARPEPVVCEALGNGGVATEIFKKLGYKVVLFSRPDWLDTFVWPELALNLKNKDTGDVAGRFSFELPLAKLDYSTATAKTAAELPALVGHGGTGKLAFKIANAELAKTTPAHLDRLVINEFIAWLTTHEVDVKAGGHVFIIYLSGLHSPQLPVEGVEAAGKLALPRTAHAPDLFRGATDRELTVVGNDVGGTFMNVLLGTTTPAWLSTVSALDRRQLFAHTYEEQARIVDEQLASALAAYDKLKDEHFLVVMGDHGESLWENGLTLHGHRPAQKSVEAPILMAHVKHPGVDKKRTVTAIHPAEAGKSPVTVAQMDIFPALFRSLLASDTILTTWGIEKLVFSAGRRDQCHLSAEPNRTSDSYRFSIYDSKTGHKAMYWGATGSALESTDFFLTHRGDYWDNPSKEAWAESEKRCFTHLLTDLYKP